MVIGENPCCPPPGTIEASLVVVAPTTRNRGDPSANSPGTRSIGAFTPSKLMTPALAPSNTSGSLVDGKIADLATGAKNELRTIVGTLGQGLPRMIPERTLLGMPGANTSNCDPTSPD